MMVDFAFQAVDRFRGNNWISLFSFGYMDVDFVGVGGFRGFRFLGRPPTRYRRSVGTCECALCYNML